MTSMTGVIASAFASAILVTLIGTGLFGVIIFFKPSKSPRWVGVLLTVESGILLGLFVALSSELVIPNPPISISLIGMLPLAPALAGALAAGLGLLLLYWIANRSRLKKALAGPWLIFSGLLVGMFTLLIVAVAVSPAVEEAIPFPSPSSTPPPTLVPAVESISPTLPEGFHIQATVELHTFVRPASMTLGPNGELYVGHAGGITVLEDTTGDGKHDSSYKFTSELVDPLGMTYRDGSLYVSSEGRVVRVDDPDGDYAADSLEVLYEGLPHNVYAYHSNNGLAFGPDDRLYIALGGTSDHGPENHPLGATILVTDLAGGPLEIYASGLRNPYDLAFCSDGQLYATDNGPDQVKVDDESLIYTPPDELNLVIEGADYGYPDIFGQPPAWSNSVGPIAYLPANGAVTGIVCYERDQFPHEFAGGLFITSWRASKLIYVDLQTRRGETLGEIRYFASGWQNPIDLAIDRDGSLLVLDWSLGQVFRISYVG